MFCSGCSDEGKKPGDGEDGEKPGRKPGDGKKPGEGEGGKKPGRKPGDGGEKPGDGEDGKKPGRPGDGEKELALNEQEAVALIELLQGETESQQPGGHSPGFACKACAALKELCAKVERLKEHELCVERMPMFCSGCSDEGKKPGDGEDGDKPGRKPGDGGRKPGEGEGGKKPGRPGDGGKKPGEGEGGKKRGRPGDGGKKPGEGEGGRK